MHYPWLCARHNPCNVVPWHGWCQAMPRRAMSWHAVHAAWVIPVSHPMPCHAVPCRACSMVNTRVTTPCHAMPCHTPCHATPRHAEPHHIMQHNATSCNMPRHATCHHHSLGHACHEHLPAALTTTQIQANDGSVAATSLCALLNAFSWLPSPSNHQRRSSPMTAVWRPWWRRRCAESTRKTYPRCVGPASLCSTQPSWCLGVSTAAPMLCHIGPGGFVANVRAIPLRRCTWYATPASWTRWLQSTRSASRR